MKILYNALLDTSPTEQRTCQGCHSKLELEPSDYTYTYDNRDGNALIYECPVCQKNNWVDVRVVNEKVLRRVKR
jgi:hypothetical protein